MGVVYRADDTTLRRSVALKFLRPDITRDDDAKRRFVLEAQAASALDHPNICTIYEIDETPGGQLFIAMAYDAGETLKAKIDRGPLKLCARLRHSDRARTTLGTMAYMSPAAMSARRDAVSGKSFTMVSHLCERKTLRAPQSIESEGLTWLAVRDDFRNWLIRAA